MPELPEVETVVHSLRPDVVGRTITDFTTTWPKHLNMPDEDAFRARLSEQRIEKVWRRAKYIIFELEDDYLLCHLKMTGRMYVIDDPDDGDDWIRATFPLDDGRTLCFSDSRKFGRLYLVADYEDITGGLGPEPLEDDFTLAVFRDLLEPRSGMIKPLLLNQRFIAGVGNIYADESLWKSRIDPRRKADTLTEEEITALYAAIRQVLARGIEREGASINWYRKPDGTKGNAQDDFNVYDQHGAPCPRCGTTIEKLRVSQRGTHICPVCQE